MRKVVVFTLCALMMVLRLGIAPALAADKPVTLRMNSGWAENNANNLGMEAFIQKVRDKTGGTVTVKWAGGPEAIPPNQLAEALKNGVVDIAWTSHTYAVSHIPVLEGMKLTNAAKMRKNGGYKFIDDLYDKTLKSHYLCTVSDGLTYNMYVKRKIQALSDFKGLTIRATPAYQAFMEALGAGVTNMNATEAYQAFERDVIQGTGWPSVGVMDMAWPEVCEFVLEPAFYNVDVCMVISNAAWNKLSAAQKKAVDEAALEIEVWSRAYYANAIEADRAKLTAAGMKVLELPPEVAKQYLDIAYAAAWKNVLKNAPQLGAKLQGFAGGTGK